MPHRVGCSRSADCCPRGHCAQITGDCINAPGANGAKCSNVSYFDADPTLGTSLYRTSAVPGIHCIQMEFTARALRSYANTWLTKIHKENVKWVPRSVESRTGPYQIAEISKVPVSWKGCFGCGLVKNGACCRGHGTCMHGLCICQPGFSGIDCGHANRGAPQSRAASGLSIYVYDLPVDLGLAAFAFNAYKRRGGDTIYLAEWHFLEALLGDSGVRTTDPATADLFFVPTFSVQGVASNFFCNRGQMELIVQHLAQHSPYWRRSGGRDHFFFLAGDKGACGLPLEIARRPIFLTHFGLLGPHTSMPKAQATRRSFNNASQLVREVQTGAWCHAPHKDIVVPPLIPRSPGQPPATRLDVTRPWRHLLVHAGGIFGPAGVAAVRKGWERARYSQGMRQELFETFPTPREGIVIAERRLPESVFAAAKLCLAPTGEGWGVRLVKGLVSGCVPLIAQPLIEQPFEALLEYESFSRRMTYGDATKLPKVLSDTALPPKLLHRMRGQLAPAARALEWRSHLGGLAYNLTILALCHRAVELRGELRTPGASCELLGRALLPLVGVSAEGVAARARQGRPAGWLPKTVVDATNCLVDLRRSAMERCERQHIRGCEESKARGSLV